MNAVMAPGRRPPHSGYTWFGRVVDRQTRDRGIMNATEHFRRIDAIGGYPRRLSPATIINMLKGEQPVPQAFKDYTVLVMEAERPLSEAERDELDAAFAGGQVHPEDFAITEENREIARRFVAELREREGRYDAGDSS